MREQLRKRELHLQARGGVGRVAASRRSVSPRKGGERTGWEYVSAMGMVARGLYLRDLVTLSTCERSRKRHT